MLADALRTVLLHKIAEVLTCTLLERARPTAKLARRRHLFPLALIVEDTRAHQAPAPKTKRAMASHDQSEHQTTCEGTEVEPEHHPFCGGECPGRKSGCSAQLFSVAARFNARRTINSRFFERGF
jgi:hypothetical protein